MDGTGMSRWIWYFGDYEIHQQYLMHMRRTERDCALPPIWRLDDCFHSVQFVKNLSLSAPETVIVYAKGVGSASYKGRNYPLGAPIMLERGEGRLEVSVMNASGLPALFVEGTTVKSDQTWLATQYSRALSPVGFGDFADKDDDLERFPFVYSDILLLTARRENGGTLFDYGRETFARLIVPRLERALTVCYGETEMEALDAEHSYLIDRFAAGQAPVRTEGRAFRYLYLPEYSAEQPPFIAQSESLPLTERGAFACDDARLNNIWRVAADTFSLCARECFLDGIKRDRWVWSGDAYQSFFINRYLHFDEAIARRTLIALRGQDPVERHINIILDYSFYWLMALKDHYMMTGDKAFLAAMYARAASLMDFCLARRDKDGLAGQYGDDWIFVDWADIDKDGAVCAEQMLFVKTLEAVGEMARIIGRDGDKYLSAAAQVRGKIESFWDEEKGAYIDCVASGKRHVTRHANIFALLYGFADDARAQKIVKNVLLNDAVPPITTPYFKFFEMEALCRIGLLDEALKRIDAYWGGMLDGGATSFFEEYDPQKPVSEQLTMYGVRYDKSLCHAWGASPIYLIGRYFLGVSPTDVGYKTFSVKPNLAVFTRLDAAVPVKNGVVRFSLRDQQLTVTADRDGGTLKIGESSYPLVKNCAITKYIR